MQSTGSSSATAPKAGFWVRFLAYLLDALILVVPLSILGVIVVAAAGGMSSDASQPSAAFTFYYLIAILASAGYFVYFWSRPDGQTLGMKALHIRVVKTDGAPLTPGTAVVRFIGTIVNSIIFGLPIGWIWAAFDANKQGWHDKLAGTYVVKTT